MHATVTVTVHIMACSHALPHSQLLAVRWGLGMRLVGIDVYINSRVVVLLHASLSPIPGRLFITLSTEQCRKSVLQFSNRKLACFQINSFLLFFSLCWRSLSIYWDSGISCKPRNRVGLGTRLYSQTSTEFEAAGDGYGWPSLHMWIWQTSPWPPAAARLHDLPDDGIRRLTTRQQGHRWFDSCCHSPLRKQCTLNHQTPRYWEYATILIWFPAEFLPLEVLQHRWFAFHHWENCVLLEIESNFTYFNIIEVYHHIHMIAS